MKQRLDLAIVSRGLAASRSRAQQLIAAGAVAVSGKVVKQASLTVEESAVIAVTDIIPYVGRGGLKLAAALDQFKVAIAGCICLDVGSSTGGFTDCLLQRGATKVYAVDVGHGQLAASLRQDQRVVAMEGTDIRRLSGLPEPIDLAVIDVSFISLRLVLPAVRPLLRLGRLAVVALVKPQFEAGPQAINRRGIVRSDTMREKAVADLLAALTGQGWQVKGLMPSPVTGGDGNIEYLVHLG